MRRAHRAAAGAAAVALLGGLIGITASPAAADPDPFGEVSPVLVVMDVSGSMDEVDDLNERRIDVARSAMLGLVRDLGAGSLYGMLSYPGGKTVDGCTIGEVRTRLAPLEVAPASADIRRLRPDGDTPTGPALQHAMQVLVQAGYDRGTVVLVSDGESNCGPPPCEVAQDIVDSGFDLRVYPVGFHLQTPNEELSCVADVTGGDYVDASDEAGLAEALGQAVPGHLLLDADVPDVLSVRTGTYDDLTRRSQISATVTSDGRLAAHDVRISLSILDSTDNPILVARPIRHLGNLEPGTSRTVTFTVRPEEEVVYADWELVVTARNAASQRLSGRVDIDSGLDLTAVGPLLAGIDHVVVMGDSYSSGEGTGIYAKDSPAKCHRSGRNYGGWLYEDGADNIACSGAVTQDFFYPDESGGKQVPAQLKQLRSLMTKKGAPEAVFLSVGGNDAGFGAVGAGCVILHKCGVPVGSEGENLTELASSVAPSVWSALLHVDAAANDATAQQKRGTAEVPIIVLPYPRIIPETGTGVKGCQIGLSTEEIDILNPYIDALNGAVRSAVYRLRKDGRPVYYASYVVDAFQPNHTICEGVNRSFANMDNFQAAQQQDVYLNDPEILHPNTQGYQAEARALVAWSHSAEAAPVEVEGSVTWDPGVVHDKRPEQQTCIPLTCLLEPGETGELARAGFAPDSQVVVRFASTPRTVGSFTTDKNGEVHGFYEIPSGIEPGEHRLDVLGVDPTGQLLLDSEPVRVEAPGTGWWRIGGIVGVLLVAVGVVGWLLRRRGPNGRQGSSSQPE